MRGEERRSEMGNEERRSEMGDEERRSEMWVRRGGVRWG